MESNNIKSKIGRRDMLKGLATVPFLGALLVAWWNKRRKDHYMNENIFNEIKVSTRVPESGPVIPKDTSDFELFCDFITCEFEFIPTKLTFIIFCSFPVFHRFLYYLKCDFYTCHML